MGLCNNPTCRKCGNEEETSVHILCECEALVSLRHTCLGSFFLDPEDTRVLAMGPPGTLLKEQGSHNPVQNRGHKGPVLRPRCTRLGRAQTQTLFYSIVHVVVPTRSNISVAVYNGIHIWNYTHLSQNSLCLHSFVYSYPDDGPCRRRNK
jgi:hypothetical protein